MLFYSKQYKLLLCSMLILFVVTLVRPGWAGVESGVVLQVTNDQNQAVAGAVVLFADGQPIRSNQNGEVHLGRVHPGTYRYSISHFNHQDRSDYLMVSENDSIYLIVLKVNTDRYDWDTQSLLYPGIRHARIVSSEPRRMVINCLQIDTYTEGLQFYTTERSDPWVLHQSETIRQSTRDFIKTSQSGTKQVVAGINATGWRPWPAPWNEATFADLSGLVISEGLLVSEANGTPSFIVYKDSSVAIVTTRPSAEISTIHVAVSGFGYALRNGIPVASSDVLHPRTAIGICSDQRYVYFMTIDGRQLASAGATINEVGQWLEHFGSHSGINMDGGGSTTMAWWNLSLHQEDKSELLNFPVGGGIPFWPTERYNGNNIGVYVRLQP